MSCNCKGQSPTTEGMMMDKTQIRRALALAINTGDASQLQQIARNAAGFTVLGRQQLPPTLPTTVQQLPAAQPVDAVTRREFNDAIASLRGAIGDLGQSLRAYAGPSGPDVWGADRNAGASAWYSRNVDPAKGGLNTTDIVTIDPADPVSTTYVFSFTGDDLARLRGTIGCRLFANVAGAGPIFETAPGYRVELRRNRVPIAPIINQPLMVLLPNLDGETRAINLSQPFSDSDEVTIVVTKTAAIASANVNTNDVSFSIDSGGSCSLPMGAVV